MLIRKHLVVENLSKNISRNISRSVKNISKNVEVIIKNSKNISRNVKKKCLLVGEEICYKMLIIWYKSEKYTFVFILDKNNRVKI